MKYYIIAGEASGDLHGSNLVRELKQRDPAATIRCWGGDKMREAGAELVKHYRDLAFMGFAEVLLNLRTILRNLKFCKEDMAAWQPDVLILIDYPGFNLRIAEWAHDRGLRVVYYISPQVWAWKENRVRSMKRCIDRMLVILPFEKEYFRQKWQWETEYVGHPLVQVVSEFKQHYQPATQPAGDERPLIALLPGSRRQEIVKKLPIMLGVTKRFPAYRFAVAQAPAIEDAFYQPIISPYPNVSLAKDQTYALLMEAQAALVTSGTATLETALFGVPEVVCYKASRISYEIGKRLIRIPYISLVNLIMNKPVVKELIQHDLTVDKLQQELELLLHNEERRRQLQQDYAELWQRLGEGGNASAKAAGLILDFLTK